MNNSPMVVD